MRKIVLTDKKERILIWGILVPVGAAAIVLVIVLSFTQRGQTVDAQEGKQQAQQSAQSLQVKADLGQSLAEGIGAVCINGGDALKELQKVYPNACQQAQAVTQAPNPSPGPQGKTGDVGPAGRGIISTAITAGHLFLTYSDGAVEDKGQVVGPQGVKGDAGRGIVGTTIAAGHLILNYSDNTSADAGQVVGKDGVNGATGATGATGPAGRGIALVSETSDAQLMVTYTDGTTAKIGPLPQGPKGDTGATGPQGVSVTRQYFDRDSSGSCRNYNDFSDGRTRVDEGAANDAACPPITTSTATAQAKRSSGQ